MKKIFYFFVVFAVALVSCSKDDSDSASDSFENLVVNTKTPIFNSSTNSYSAGGNLSVALQNDNFYGTQFHPEKSGDVGSTILENFLKLK